MSGFRVGDEVVCVDASAADSVSHPPKITVRQTYVVSALGLHPGNGCGVAAGAPTLFLANTPPDNWNVGYLAARFRKVERRNSRLTIEAFSVIKDGGFEEPRRAPAKKRERAQ